MMVPTPLTELGALLEDAAERGQVDLGGFGTFQVHHYEGYLGRNPTTGAEVPVAPKWLLSFDAGPALLEAAAGKAGTAVPRVKGAENLCAALEEVRKAFAGGATFAEVEEVGRFRVRAEQREDGAASPAIEFEARAVIQRLVNDLFGRSAVG